MSGAALVWAMRHKGWCTSTGELSVLTAIADHMNKDLRSSYASHATLAKETIMSTRSVGTHVRALAKRGVIVPGDPSVLSHVRPDRRPPVWDFPTDLPKDPPTTGKDFHPSEMPTTEDDGPRVAAPATRKRTTGGKSAQPRVETVADEPGTAEPGEDVGGDGRRPSTGSGGSGGRGQAASGKKGAPKVAAADLRRVVERIPGPLATRLAAEFPQGLPAAAVDGAIAKVLVGEQRTVEQLVDRVERRWLLWSYEDDAVAEFGRGLDSPVGVLLTLLGPSACWGNHTRCEDGVDLDTGVICPRCQEARQDRATERRAQEGPEPKFGYSIPFQRPSGTGPTPYVLCLGSGCGRKMMPTQDGLCRECREFGTP